MGLQKRKTQITCNEFSRDTKIIGSGALALCGEADGTGLFQSGKETAFNSSFPIPSRTLL